MRGIFFIIAAPSGCGKTTIVKRLLPSLAQMNVSISYTTRPKRAEEIEGQDYHFVSEARFQALVEAGDFLEHAKVFGHYYGTPKSKVVAKLDQGTDVLLEIDWQGCQQIKAMFPESVAIFILPPSEHTLKQRLSLRNQDSKAVTQVRMEGVASEVSHCHEFDFLVLNDDLDRAVADCQAIIRAMRLQARCQIEKNMSLLNELMKRDQG